MQSSTRTPFEHATALVAVAALLSACGYQSSYVAPADGRARPVWRDSNVVVEMSGAPLPPQCAAAMAEASQTGRLRLATGDLRLDGGYWAPRYYGPRIIVVGRIAPPLLRPPIFFPHFGGGAYGGGPRMGLSSGGMKLGSTGGSGGGGGGMGKGAAYLAILIIITLSIVDIAVALSDPESSSSSQAIDQVNAFNDMARMIGSPCSYYQYETAPGSTW